MIGPSFLLFSRKRSRDLKQATELPDAQDLGVAGEECRRLRCLRPSDAWGQGRGPTGNGWRLRDKGKTQISETKINSRSFCISFQTKVKQPTRRKMMTHQHDADR